MHLPRFASLLGLLVGWGLAVTAQGEENMRQIVLRTHSLSAPYLETDLQNRWFDFGGDAYVKTDSYIRLAPDQSSRMGWLFSKIPLTATNWEIEVEFKIHGKGTLHGDGMAMWITKQRAMGGEVFGAADKFEGLGIFFDTYKNNRPGVVFPYVMAMVGDGQTSYDKSTDGKEQELAGCSARGIRGASIPTKARLTYYQDKSLKLELRYKSEDEWTLCFETGAVAIPPVSYLGFSAETGELSDNFDIISVETKNLYGVAGDSFKKIQEEARNTKSKYKNDKKAAKAAKAAKKAADKAAKKAKSSESSGKSSGGWGWFFIKTILFILACGGSYLGFTMYRSSTKKYSRFD